MSSNLLHIIRVLPSFEDGGVVSVWLARLVVLKGHPKDNLEFSRKKTHSYVGVLLKSVIRILGISLVTVHRPAAPALHELRDTVLLHLIL